MRRLFSVVLALYLCGGIAGCSAPESVIGRTNPPSIASPGTGSASNRSPDAKLSTLFSQARSHGPLSIPPAGTKLPYSWGTQVPVDLYVALPRSSVMTFHSVPPTGEPSSLS